MESRKHRFGALAEGGGTHFRVWAPQCRTVDLVIAGLDRPEQETPLAKQDAGFFQVFVPEAGPGTRYGYRLDGGTPFPDPASRHQPDGVHGLSAVVDPSRYDWRDTDYQPPPQSELVFYELHVGTFSPEGSYDGARRRLPYLRDLGITALELMPLADFPGRRNWGYDPAALWAPTAAYGRPDELRALVDEAHQLGMAVLLDVVYNHFSPDGAYLCAFGPFLTGKHQTPWGQAINLDGAQSAAVREFLWSCALQWLEEYHFDGLRLDAIFALCDDSPQHWLAGLVERVRQLEGPPRYLIGEDNRNLDTVVRPSASGGTGLDGVWADDLHHLVRRYIAGDQHGYYADYPTSTEAIAETLEAGWYYRGQPSAIDGRPRGSATDGIPSERFVVCIQNHDQIGNRPFGDRLDHIVDRATYRAASALLLCAPQLPLLFMGQEWAASSPFCYFTDHAAELAEAVQRGRREEFKDFPGFGGEVADPQSTETFALSRLRWEERSQSPHAQVERLYRDLLARRREIRQQRPFSARSPVEGGLELRYGRYALLVALRGRLRLPVAGPAEWVWHTENAELTDDTPVPPRADAGHIWFERPGALLLEQAAPAAHGAAEPNGGERA